MSIVIRKAASEDVEPLYELIQGYAEQGIMLPRSREMLREQISWFAVAVDGERFIGCGSLCQLGKDLVEIRSLGIVDGYKGKGVGGMLVDFLVEEARAMEVPKVMALTYAVGFFEKNGFTVVPKEVFPEKVWKDCIHCKKQHCCDETAVVKQLAL